MITRILSFFFEHFFMGLGFCLFAFFWCRQRGRRRRFFRFGGDGPFSIGTKRRWIGWYLFGYVFEVITSFWLAPYIYWEIAASIFQAAIFTLGLFVMDRIAMMFEPKGFWLLEIPNKHEDAKLPFQRSWLRERYESFFGSAAGLWGRMVSKTSANSEPSSTSVDQNQSRIDQMNKLLEDS